MTHVCIVLVWSQLSHSSRDSERVLCKALPLACLGSQTDKKTCRPVDQLRVAPLLVAVQDLSVAARALAKVLCAEVP